MQIWDENSTDIERKEHNQKIAFFSTRYYVYPLFLSFGICDYLYYPEYFTVFFSLRVATCILVFLFGHKVVNSKNFLSSQIWSVPLMLSCSLPLNIMVAILGDYGSPYALGINLVILGMSIGFRFDWKFYFGILFGVTSPFLVGGLISSGFVSSSFYFLNAMLIFGTALISAVTKYYYEKLHQSEHFNRTELKKEIKNRDQIITVKTEEAVNLEKLGAQFSPQVIEQIRKQGLEYFQKTNRALICAIFIDIVNSTERLRTLDHENFSEVVEVFMEDCLNILLRYDLTIDKFYGDGVLAFSNQPIKRSDYIQRVAMAALEIAKITKSKSDYYSKKWNADFEITMGIAAGYATVGFFGNRSYIKQYSAIGEPLPLAQRLSSLAKPGQILLGPQVAGVLSELEVEKKFIGRHTLKGFESDKIHVYELLGLNAKSSSQYSGESDMSCGECSSSNLFLDEENGIYLFRCRDCGSTNEASMDVKKAA